MFVIVDEYSRYPIVEIVKSESANTVMKCVKSSFIEGRNYKQVLYDFLRQYRATPHTSTGIAPFTLMFERKPTTRMPNIDNVTKGNAQMREIVQQKDDQSKIKAKMYEDKRLNVKGKLINIVEF